MRGFVIALALSGILMPAVLADPAPTQTPAQLQNAAPAAPAPGMPSQTEKAAVQSDKARKNAQLAAHTPPSDMAGDKKPKTSQDQP